MNRRLALALLAGVGLALLLVGPGASAVTYPQAGYDAGRTGDVPFDLPRANDTAFEVELPGTPTGTVAINGSTAYVVTLDHGFEVENETLDSNALWEIDLDTAEVTKRFEVFDERPDWSTAFTDGERVYTQVEREVTAYELDGEQLWTWTVPNRLPQAEHVTCFDDPAFRDGTMYLACLEVRQPEADTPTGEKEAEEVPETNLLVAALTADSGDEQWVWFESIDDDPDNHDLGSEGDGGREEDTPSELWDTLNAEVSATADRVFVYGFVIDRDRAYTTDGALGGETGPERYERWYAVWGLGAEDGDYEVYEQGPTVTFSRQNFRQSFNSNTRIEKAFDGKVAATSTTTFLETGIGERVDGGALSAFNPSDGAEQWTQELATADVLKRTGSHAIGVRDETVLAAAPRALTAFTASGEIQWETKLDPARNLTYGTSPLLLGADTAVVETLHYEPRSYNVPSLNRSGYGLQAVNLETGQVLWEHDFTSPVQPPGDRFTRVPDFEEQWLHSSTPGFGSGVIVAASPDGRVEVLGDTPLSMDGPDLDTERFPPAGENVTIDLSDTEPGAFGEASRYRVEWGDGAATPWREDPVFTHAYEEEGNVTARVFAGNDENQTTSTFVTMRVGQTEPNFIETAFKQENQDMTFGVLGVALALGGGLVGVGRRYRKRSNLQDELEALEEGFEETKNSPGECEAFLDERKARARSLALDGYLREDQVGVVENRAEELRARLRTDALEEEFGFLPHSLVVKAREMVQDGQVTRLEREAFLRALEEDEMLTRQQKATVRERIEAWFARDAGGGGASRGEEIDDA